MSNGNSMKPVLIGAIVAALVIGAFVLRQTRPFESEGPVERLGEKLDQAAEAMKEGVNELQEGAGRSGE